MRTARFENTWESIQDIMPINNALSSPEWDKVHGEFIITTKKCTMVVKTGELIIFDDCDNAMCHIVECGYKDEKV